MSKEIFYFKIKSRNLIADNQKAWLDYLAKNDTKRMIGIFEKEYGVRSYNQNSYLWGVVYKLVADHTGHTENEIHDYCKRVFLPPQFKVILNREIKMPASTRDLNKFDFGEYVDKIIAMAAGMGIVVPPPVKKNSGKKVDYPNERYTPAF